MLHSTLLSGMENTLTKILQVKLSDIVVCGNVIYFYLPSARLQFTECITALNNIKRAEQGMSTIVWHALGSRRTAAVSANSSSQIQFAVE